MPRNAKLKVYRTPIGFHDAYVAAPSQKAALEAWGSDANLFARGSAELVTDEDLSREPLANPGKVIRRLRGTAEEQIAALPEFKPAGGRATKEDEEAPSARPRAKRAAPQRKTPPRPDRGPLDAAHEAKDHEEAAFDEARGRLAKRQAELDRERRSLETAHDAESTKLQKALDRAEEAYNRAMQKWRA